MENSKLLGSRICGGNTAYKRAEADFYPTPKEATFALCDFLKGRGLVSGGAIIWEPACGDGEMVEALREAFPNNSIVYSDIRETALCFSPFDFLDAKNVGAIGNHSLDWIITNPPFSVSERFIRTANELGWNYAFMLKSQYWHSKKRLQLFREAPPSFVLPLTWRPDFCAKQRGKGSPLMDVIWCVWARRYRYQPTQYIPLEKTANVCG